MGKTGRKTAIPGLIGFELFLKFTCLSLGFPAVRGVINLCIRASGYSYITKENVASFFKKPLCIFFLFLFFLVFALLVFYEMCAVSLAVCQRRSGIRVTASGLFYGAGSRAKKLLFQKPSGVLTAFFSLLFVFFIDLPVILFLFFGLKQTEGVVRNFFSPAGIALLLFAVLILWWFALFGCSVVLLPEIVNETVGGEIRETGKRLFKNYKRLLDGLLKRSMALFVIESGIYVAGLFGMVFLVRRMVSAAMATVVLLHTFERFHLIICILFATVNAVFCEFFCASLLYEKSTEGEAEEFFTEALRFARENKPCSRKRKLLFCMAVGVVLLSSALSTVSFFRNGAVLLAETLDTLNITAHRGASLNAPENSFPAVERAVAELADYVELDVRLTADGIPVLSHDASLYRTTGVSRYIWSMTFEELSAYDIGRRFGEQFGGERVPALREIFAKYGGSVGFNLDLKPYGNDAVAERVVELIEEYYLEDSCIITSTSLEVLERVKLLNPNIKTGHILSIVYGDFYKNKAVDFFSIHSGFITDEVVKQAHSVGKEVHAWTVNKDMELLRLKAIGVDNIITDNPAFARKIVYDENIVDTLEEWMKLLLPKK